MSFAFGVITLPRFYLLSNKSLTGEGRTHKDSTASRILALHTDDQDTISGTLSAPLKAPSGVARVQIQG